MASLRSRLSVQAWTLPGPWGIVGIVAGAVVLGIVAGFLTTVIPRWIAHSDADPSPTASPSPSSTPDPVIPVNLYPPITRSLDTDDLYAGLNDLVIPTVGTGEFIVATGVDEPDTTAPVHWVRVEIEEGLPLTPEALAVYVMSVINDERGWGARGRMVFARTDGAAEYRIIFATPETASKLCERPHEAAEDRIEPPGMNVEPTPSPSVGASASPSLDPSPPSPVEPSCATQGMIVIDTYRWADGIRSFEEDRVAARIYLLNHFLGHALGHPDAVCTEEGERASVMVDHEFDISPCLPGQWPNPVT